MSRITCLILAILVTIIFAGGCGDDDGGNNLNEHQNPPGWEVNDVVIADNVKVIDESVDVTVESATLTIPASQADKVKDVQVGAIVVSEKGSGFLRRVISVSETANGIVFGTESASLAEVIQQGRISGPIPLDFSSNPSQKDGFGLDLSGQVLYDENGLTITLTQATINFKPDLNLAIEFDGSSLDYFKVDVVGNLSGSLVAQVVYDGDASFSQTIPLYESAPIITTVWAGYVPIVIVTTLQVEAGFVASLEGSLTFEGGVNFSSEVTTGVEYRDGQWIEIDDRDFQLTAIGPTLDVSVNTGLRVFLRPKIVTKLYSIAGPTIAIEPNTRLAVDLLPDPGWKLFAGVRGTIDLEIEAFDKVLADYSATLFDFEELLASGPLDLCEDEDEDGYGVGANCLGEDCDDTDPGIWIGCVDCSDNDSDGHDGYDAVSCITGDDNCDSDPYNWTLIGCSSCIDGDGDGYGVDCDQGDDCDDGDPGIWVGCINPVPISIAGGIYHSCVLKDDGTVWCWGRNSSGELGDGQTHQTCGLYDCSSTPVLVSGITGVAAIGVGGMHSCAVKGDGTAWCWGSNSHCQFGDGTATDSLTPVQVSSIASVAAIGGGTWYSCAVKSDGTAWCWGANWGGQLGDGTTTGSSIPVQVSGSAGFTVIGLDWHSCAVKSDGTAWCWGPNGGGQLGDGTTTGSSIPVQVSGITNAVSISVGSSSACVVKSDGTAWCWGENDYGQLGDGTTTGSFTPVQVSGITNAVSISGGGYSACVVKSDGTVWCWGANSNGQLGDGQVHQTCAGHDCSPIPVQVSGITGVITIGGANSHFCAVKSDCTVWCWGGNQYGQLGDGQSHQICIDGFDCSPIPVQVIGL